MSVRSASLITIFTPIFIDHDLPSGLFFMHSCTCLAIPMRTLLFISVSSKYYNAINTLHLYYGLLRNDVLWRSVEALLKDGLLGLAVPAEVVLVVFWLLVRQVGLLLEDLDFLGTVLWGLVDCVGRALTDTLRRSIALLDDGEGLKVEDLGLVLNE